MNKHPRWIPDLDKHAPQDGAPYRPSNGTEGEYFDEGWCANCKADKNFRDDNGEGCPIIARALAYDVGDDGFPSEWQWQNGEPVCTAFDDISENITKQEREAQMVLDMTVRG